MRLHHRIVIPFGLVALVTTSAAAWVVLSVTTRALEMRVEAQTLNTAAMVSGSDFALNPTILQSVKAIAGADVVTFDERGNVLATTTNTSRAAAVIKPVLERRLAWATGTPEVHRLDCAGAPCDVAYRRLSRRADAVVAVAVETSELAAATAAVTRTVLLATLASLLVIVLVGQALARQVTAPLEALVQFSRDVGAGLRGDATPARRAPDGPDEIGRLGTAFNDMLDRLDRSREALVRSEKLGLAGLLAARVAHDVRNPLSSIKMQTQLLRARLQASRDGETRELVDAVLHDIAQVEHVVSDLLELARPGALARKPASLNAVVRDALEQVRLQLTHRRIAVTTRLDASLPDIPIDVARFRQVLLNVINNAADAMPVGGTLAVATRPSADRSTIELDVCDDGTGIAPAMLEHVFDPFVSTKRDGVGLGLVNAKAVVESHGGAITLAPRPSAGTIVTIRLPVGEAAHG